MQPVPLAIISLAVITIGVLIAAYWAAYDRQRTRLLAARGQRGGIDQGGRPDAAARRDRAPTVTRILGQSQVRATLQTQILRAGWLLRPSEFVAISALSGMVVSAILLIPGRSVIMAAAGLALGAYIPWVVMAGRQKQRDRALSQQLPNALDMVTAALRAGASLAKGLEVVQAQMHPPISQEVERALDEARFGISHATALRHIVERTGNYDMELAVTAMLTQLQMGGNLTEILESIAEVIRERIKLEGEIATASAAGKMSAAILTILPFAMAAAIQVMNPSYLRPLYTTPLGITLAIASVIMIALGTYLMQRIVAVDL